MINKKIICCLISSICCGIGTIHSVNAEVTEENCAQCAYGNIKITTTNDTPKKIEEELKTINEINGRGRLNAFIAFLDRHQGEFQRLYKNRGRWINLLNLRRDDCENVYFFGTGHNAGKEYFSVKLVGSHHANSINFIRGVLGIMNKSVPGGVLYISLNGHGLLPEGLYDLLLKIVEINNNNKKANNNDPQDDQQIKTFNITEPAPVGIHHVEKQVRCALIGKGNDSTSYLIRVENNTPFVVKVQENNIYPIRTNQLPDREFQHKCNELLNKDEFNN